MTIDNGAILAIASLLGTVIATLAGAVAWMTKRHLAALDASLKEQAKHILHYEQERDKMQREYDNNKHRVKVLEDTMKVLRKCPKEDCPNVQVLRLTAPVAFVNDS